MGREQCTLRAREIRNEDVRIRAFGVLLGVDDRLAIFRPDRPDIHFFFGGTAGEVTGLPGHGVKDVNFKHRRCFRLDHVREIAPVGRPGRAFFRDLAGVGDVQDLPALWRNQKHIPLFVSVVVRHVGDPFAIGRPGGGSLALVADRKLHRPSALGGNQPQIVPAGNVRDKNNRLRIRGPGGSADGAGHVKALEREALLSLFDISVGRGCHLFGVADGGGRGKRLRKRQGAHYRNHNKAEESSHAGSV